MFLSTFGSILPGGDTPAIRPFCNRTVAIVRLQTGHFEGSRSEASPSYTNFSGGGGNLPSGPFFLVKKR